MTKADAIERLQYFGRAYFFDAMSEKDAISDLQELFQRDSEFREIAQSAFGLALGGEIEGSESLKIVLDDFNHWVESEKDALDYLARIRKATLGEDNSRIQ